jgi:hypothetical protein
MVGVVQDMGRKMHRAIEVCHIRSTSVAIGLKSNGHAAAAASLSLSSSSLSSSILHLMRRRNVYCHWKVTENERQRPNVNDAIFGQKRKWPW